MIRIDSIADLRAWRGTVPAGTSVGFVPTMGALHEGHRALLRTARAECAVTVASVFVNPTQFGPGEDLAVYPRDPEGDRRVLGEEAVDVGWFGRTEDLYPPGFATHVELPSLADGLCGRERPGHFSGVSLIVAKLLSSVRPDRAYFGLKDYQQFVIVRQMVADLNLGVEIVGCPTRRESDGLALSSRNRRLTSLGREVAPTLYQGLLAAQGEFLRGERRVASLCLAALRPILDQDRIRLEYLELVDAVTLERLDGFLSARGGLLAVAARVDGVRLIDNLVLADDPVRTVGSAPGPSSAGSP